MAQFVKFEGNLIGIEGKDFNLIDSNKNVKKIAGYYKKLLEDVDAETPGVIVAADNAVALLDLIDNAIADIADLNKTETKNLENCSFSDKYGIFNEMLKKYLGVGLPSMQDISEEDADDDFDSTDSEPGDDEDSEDNDPK
ncbi:hypothetical protein [Paucilactobacillus sp. N302-9]